MKTIAISSFFVLFALVAGISATIPDAFADHAEVTITTGPGNLSVPGCEETNDCYVPETATVDAGGKVIMTNTDPAGIHTWTSGTVDGFTGTPDGVFESGMLNADQSYEWIADVEPGEYPYYCMLHTWMQGTIVVQEVAAEEEHMEEEAHEEEHMEEETTMMEKDDHGDDHGDHMDDEGHLITEASATGMMSDGTTVSVWTTEPMAGEMMEIHVEFVDSEHVNHDITVTQNGETVLDDMGAHHHGGSGMHTTAPLSSSDPVDITITFQGYGIDDLTGPIGEEVVFSNVVPEFGTIAMMVLAVAIISIIAVTAKSRVIPRL